MCVNRHTVNNNAYSEITSMPDPHHITKWQSNSYYGMAAVCKATVGIMPDDKYTRWSDSTQSCSTSSLCDEAYLKMIQLCDQLWHANSWPCWCSVGMVFLIWWPHSISDAVTGSFPYKLSNSEALCWKAYNYAEQPLPPYLFSRKLKFKGQNSGKCAVPTPKIDIEDAAEKKIWSQLKWQMFWMETTRRSLWLHCPLCSIKMIFSQLSESFTVLCSSGMTDLL